MHEALLSIALMPEPPRLFRVQLRPYTLGHELHLHRRGNPILDDEMTYSKFCALSPGVKKAAVMQAVEICSRDFAGNMKPPKHWGLWSAIVDWCNINAAVESLWRFLYESHTGFKAELPSGEGMKTRMIGSPHILRLYQFVCDKIPLHEQAFYSNRKQPTAWNFPYALATMLSQSDAETRGELSVYNSMNKAVDDFAAKRDKEKENEEAEYEAYRKEQQTRHA
jgi:hypothetical protein